MRRRSRRRRRARRRTILLIVGGLFVIGILLAAAGARDLLSARSRLSSAKATIDAIVGDPTTLDTAAGRAATAQQLGYATDEVAAARRIITGSFPLRLARFVPVVSWQRSGVMRLVDDSRVALSTGTTLIGEADQLVAQGQVRGAQVPIGALAAFQVDLRTAGDAFTSLHRSSGGLWGPLGRARRQFDTMAQSTGSRLLSDADAVDVGQALLGASGPRHYLVALENNAEMRDQGAVLSYAVLAVDHGHVQVTDHGPVLTPIQVPGKGVSNTLLLKAPVSLLIPPGTAAVFGSIHPTQTWQSVNASADFDFSASAMQAMYHQATGQSVDGVIALDVPALSALLTVVGPVNVPDSSEQITAANAGTVLLHDLYNSFPVDQQVVRKELLSEVVTEAVNRLSTGSFDPLPLAQQLATAAAGGHMRVWSDVPKEEATLERTGLGGGPATTLADRTFHVAVENRNATKVDFYVATAAEQTVTITATGSAVVRTTIIVHNGSPVGAPASYQLGPDGHGTTQPGEYWAWVLLYGPAGSNQPQSVSESGLRLTQTVLDRIYAGQTKEVTFDTVIDHAVRDGKLDLRYVPQPRLKPAALSVTLVAPGWTVAGKSTWAGSWNKTMTLSWSLHR